MKIGDLVQLSCYYTKKLWPGLGIIIKQGTYQKDYWNDNSSFVILFPNTGETLEYWEEDIHLVSESK